MLGEPCRAEAQCRCSVAIMIISLFDAPPTFAQARTLADRLSRPVACSAVVVAPLGISRAAAKQTGKQHGKGTVNLGNGFASVAYESHRKQLVPGFTNPKDWLPLKA